MNDDLITVSITPEDIRIANNDIRDALRWRALLNCARIRVTGKSVVITDRENQRYLSLELWTHHPIPIFQSVIEDAKMQLINFTDAAISAQTEKNKL